MVIGDVDKPLVKERVHSICSTDSGFDGLENIEPLDLDDLEQHHAGIERLDSGVETEDNEMPNVSMFSVAMMMMKKNKIKKKTNAASKWFKALNIVEARGDVDPWDKFHLNELPVEKAIRHRYSAFDKTWSKDDVFVKIDSSPFDEGAMRECFRMKKMDKFCPNADWKKDSNNYVAKRYKNGNEHDRQTYFDDVRLQMDAKLWSEEFNRHNPPKKVDIFMVTVYEFPERDGSPLFHAEHFIEGDYIKYNSNSGFVDNRLCRQTPHAFSHFTFERSGHELIVVDVQGVGDLYTDPQIHTFNGSDYGDGNLGIKGMALFFHSHHCNSICKQLGLSPFALSATEVKEIHSQSSSTKNSISQTVLRGNEVAVHDHSEVSHLEAFFRQRLSSSHSQSDDIDQQPEPFQGSSKRRNSSISSRTRLDSELVREFSDQLNAKKRSSCLTTEMNRTTTSFNDSLLGMVHLELAKYHEVCRFTDDGTYDKEAALFHLKAAADCGVVNAIVNLAQLCVGLPHDILSEVEASDGLEGDAVVLGMEYMLRGAEAGDRSSMVYMAKAYDTGLNLADPKEQSLSKALFWYEEIKMYDDQASEDGNEPEWGMADPPYSILARQAEIYLMDEVEGVKKDPNLAGELYNLAAESAMACMKGKLANKYYMLAEEAYGQVEE